MQHAQITQALEAWAPLAYQESYDNSGWICGDPQAECRGVLTALDATEAVVEEAIEKGCNLIVAHHPIVFKGLKKLTPQGHVERAVIKALQNEVALYAIHTNLDNVATGVNHKIAEKLGLQNCRILAPKSGLLEKLTVFVPRDYTEQLAQHLHAAGAGQIGEYGDCSFRLEGTGTFRPSEAANPFSGAAGELEYAQETRVEVIFPATQRQAVLQAMVEGHPYEEVAHFHHRLENPYQEVGSGMVGELEKPLSQDQFLQHLRASMALPLIRHTGFQGEKIQQVALCGGAGFFLLGAAKAAGAQAFVTSDIKYHDFFQAEGDLLLADIGHYESEKFTKELLAEYLSGKFPKFAVLVAESPTNPVQYYTG